MLSTLAHERGYECQTVRGLGLLGAKDHELLVRIRDEDWTLVTINVDEFRNRYRRMLAVHAGLVSLVVDAGRAQQRAAFMVALDEIDANADLINVEILVESKKGRYVARRLVLP